MDITVANTEVFAEVILNVVVQVMQVAQDMRFNANVFHGQVFE